MPILRVTKNGEHLCTVGSDDVWMFSANLWGDIYGPVVSQLDIHGGIKRRADGSFNTLFWEPLHELDKFDRLTFCFEEGSRSHPPGTIFEASDDPEDKIEIPISLSAELIAEKESQPVLNGGLKWSFSLRGGSAIDLTPDAARQHIRLGVLWVEDHHPEQLRVHLKKYSLSEVNVHNPGGEQIFLEYVALGSTLEIVLS